MHIVRLDDTLTIRVRADHFILILLTLRAIIGAHLSRSVCDTCSPATGTDGARHGLLRSHSAPPGTLPSICGRRRAPLLWRTRRCEQRLLQDRPRGQGGVLPWR